MTIPLPPLPDKVPVDKHIPTGIVTYGYTQEMMRAIQREAMRVALEAAARVCRNERLMFGDEEWRVRCDLADEIEALEVGT